MSRRRLSTHCGLTLHGYAAAIGSDTKPFLVEMAVEPKSKADQDKLGVALAKLVADDPSFQTSTDHESGHYEDLPEFNPDTPTFSPAVGMRA